MLIDPDDRPREACGVFGIFAPGIDVARVAFFALYALQHRGQESAGIATSDGVTASLHKGMGLVAQVFAEDNLAELGGHLAIGQTRYSTTGSSNLANAQPYLIETMHGPLGVGHNGNLTNAEQLRGRLLDRGVGLSSSSDSEVITQMLAAPPNGEKRDAPDWGARIKAFMDEAEGAYSLVVLTTDAVYGVRDPKGFRPLCIGRLSEGGYVIASESCALATVGAEYVRSVAPGEIVRLDDTGLHSIATVPVPSPSLCVFEYVYFARPDSLLDGQMIHRVRQRLGQLLWAEAPADGDVVVGVPDSATPAAIGYAEASSIPYTEGLTKNRYIGRTFIEPNDRLRRSGVHLKYNPLRVNLEGKRVVLIDDSIVRGTTIGPLVGLLREGGATEVHVRVSSPPVRHPCFMGIDMASTGELIGSVRTVAEIADHIGADSLAYLSHDAMMAAVTETAAPGNGHCRACFTGDYPIDLPADWEHRDKLKLQGAWAGASAQR